MSADVKQIAEFSLVGTKDGKITVTIIEEPYGKGSTPVASIGIALQKDAKEPDWKVHIPKENIDEVIGALQKAKEAL